MRVAGDDSVCVRGYAAKGGFHFAFEDLDPVLVRELEVVSAMLLAAAHGNINLFISLMLSRQKEGAQVGRVLVYGWSGYGV